MSDEDKAVEAHVSKVTHNYTVRFPEHPAREDDPHYIDFNHIHNAWKKDPEKWQCLIGKHRGDFSECDLVHPLELHHAHVEFSLQNGIELTWVESAENLMVLCQFHHRGHGGAHVASASDFEGLKYVRGLII